MYILHITKVKILLITNLSLSFSSSFIIIISLFWLIYVRKNTRTKIYSFGVYRIGIYEWFCQLIKIFLINFYIKWKEVLSNKVLYQMQKWKCILRYNMYIYILLRFGLLNPNKMCLFGKKKCWLGIKCASLLCFSADVAH